MLKIIILLLIASAAVILGPMLSGRQGFVHIATDDYVIETSLTTAVIIVIVAFIAAHLLWNLVRYILHAPGGAARWFRQRGERKALTKQDRAYIAYAQGDYARALAQIQKSSPLDQLPINALLVSAKAAFAIGDFDYCRKALDEAQKRGPEVATATTIIRAKFNLKVNNAKAALEYLDSINPRERNKLIYKLYYDCYKVDTNIEKLYEAAQQLVKYKILSEDDCRGIFTEYFEDQLKKADSAEQMERAYGLLNKKDRRDARFMGPFVSKLLSLGIKDKAKTLALGFLKNNPDDTAFLQSIAAWNEDVPEVLDFLKKKASKNILTSEDNLPLLKAMGNLSLKSDLLQEALDDYKKALSLNETSDVYAKIGQILSLQQKYEEATQYFAKAQALHDERSSTRVAKAEPDVKTAEKPAPEESAPVPARENAASEPVPEPRG